MLRWVFLEFAGAVIAAEGHRVGFLRINSFATQRALVVHRLSGDFHLFDEVVGVLLELAFAVIAAEADEVALVVGRGLDGIAAEWASVVDRGGLDFGNGGTRIFGELALTVAAGSTDGLRCIREASQAGLRSVSPGSVLRLPGNTTRPA